MSAASFKKYSAILLLMAVVLVANNLAHDATHAFEQTAGSQLECDSCHMFKGSLAAFASALPVAPFVDDLFSEEPALGSLPSRFSPYLSRAPPKV